MKKLFVILLAVVLTLSVAVTASAIDAKIVMNGNVEFNYTFSPSSDAPMNFNFNKNMQLGKISVVAEDDTTWAQLNYKFNTWGQGSEYGLGFKKVGGLLDIGLYANGWDKSSTVLGQANLANLYGNFDEDPLFTNRPSDILALAINTDNISVNVEYQPNKQSWTDHLSNVDTAAVAGTKNSLYAAITAKFEGGKVYAGFASFESFSDNDTTNVSASPDTTYAAGSVSDKTQMIIGGDYKLDSLTIGLDYYTASTASVATATVIQAFADFSEAKAKVTVYDETVANVLGVGLEYTGIEKTTLGAKWFNNDRMEAYGAYQVGVITMKLDYTASAGVSTIGLGLKAGLW